MNNEKIDSGTLYYKDLLYYIVYDHYEYHIDYKVYDIYECYNKEGQLDEVREGFPYLICSNCWPIDNLDQAEVFIDGSIKWDGCSNWDFNPADPTSKHFCSQKSVVELGFLLGRLYDHAAQTLVTWNNNKTQLPCQTDVTRYIQETKLHDCF